MGLLHLQRQIAALAMEPAARAAWQRDPDSHAGRAHLSAGDAALLRSLKAADVAYFAGHRRIDRRAMLAADLPRTVARMPGRELAAYFDAAPYPIEPPHREAQRLARWLGRAGGPAALADLARFEAAQLRLLKRAAPTARGRGRPAKVVRAPGLILLDLDHRVDLDSLAPVRRGQRAHFVLRRVPGDVDWLRVGALEQELLRRADGRTQADAWLLGAARAAKATAKQAQAAAQALAAEGLLAPIPAKSRP